MSNNETKLNEMTKDILDSFGNTYDAESYERELRFKNHGVNGLTYNAYSHVLNTIKNSKKWNALPHILETSYTGTPKKGSGPQVRMTVNHYTNEKIIIIKKQESKKDYDDFSIRASISKEIDLDINNTNFQSLYNIQNTRTKNRHSFISDNKLWRLDLTIVKSQSGVNFECELEHIANSLDFKQLKTIISTFYKLINFSKSIYVASEYKEIINEYTKLLNLRFPKFIGPLPFTITNEIKSRGIISCGYSVTDKADGERKLLYINENSIGALIGRNISPIIVGKFPTLKQCMFDGEFLKATQNPKFYIFDCLFYNNIDVREESHLIRLKYAHKASTRKMKKNFPLNLYVKTFYYNHNNKLSKLKNGDIVTLKNTKNSKMQNIFDAAKLIWNNKKDYKYSLDGLIFTPIYQPYFNKNIYKWKDYDTIDFYTTKIGENETHEQWKLYIAGNNYKGDYLHFDFNGIDNKGTFLFFPYKGAKPIRTKCNIPMKHNVISVIKSIAKKYTNNEVIEYKFSNNKFLPVNTRPDKLYANNIRSVNDAWDSIINKITLNELEANYYNCVRKYHNAIKDSLIKKYSTKKSVLNIGIGAGGNIKKYSNAQVSSLNGINIVNVNPQISYNKSKMSFFKTNNELYNVHNLTKKNLKYDVINVMFAGHYFFKSKKTLLNFLNNLIKAAKPGTKLIMTLMNGQYLHKLAKNNVYENSVVKINIDSYNDKKLTGNKILVDLKGTKYFNEKQSVEYLVNISQFIKLMKNANFILKHNKSFNEYTHLQEFKLLSEDEKQFSFINNVLVFEYNSINLENNNFKDLKYIST